MEFVVMPSALGLALAELMEFVVMPEAFELMELVQGLNSKCE
jgi:hypothetical protein